MPFIYTAKSYENLPKLGDAYEKDGKYYIQVRLNNGKIKEVRAYDKPQGTATPPAAINLNSALGFSKTGYIKVYKVMDIDDDFFNKSPCRYHRVWGWYLPGNETFPNEPPSYTLLWEDAKTLLKKEGFKYVS